MRILIIGGTGNLGTPITKGVMAQGHEVVLFNYDPKPPSWLKDVRVITGDRTHRPEFQYKLQGVGKFDCVIDMICYEPADADWDVELFRGRTRQLIFRSSVDVYSKSPKAYPVTEEIGNLGARPSFPYGYKKMLCEESMWEANARGDFAVTVLRPTFTYNESWSPANHSFGRQTYHLDRLIHGKPFIMHGDGNSISVATYRDDTAGAFLGAIGNEKAFGQAYNVSGDEWMTNNYIWRTIARILKAPEPDFVYIPTDLLGKLAPKQSEWCVENFCYNNIYDNSKAKKHLGFRYTVPFEEGVRRCVEYLQKNKLIEDSSKFPFYDRIVDSWRRHSKAMIASLGPDH